MRHFIRFVNMASTRNRYESLQVEKCMIPVIKPRFFRCKVGTLNVRTASSDEKVALILREAGKAVNFDKFQNEFYQLIVRFREQNYVY